MTSSIRVWVLALCLFVCIGSCTTKGEVTINLEEYKTLLKGLEKPIKCPKLEPIQHGPPSLQKNNYVVLNIDVNGTVNMEEKLAQFAHQFHIQVINNSFLLLELQI
jgi:hypothetical protein